MSQAPRVGARPRPRPSWECPASVGFAGTRGNTGPSGPEPGGGVQGGVREGLCSLLCLLSRLGEHAPPCPFTAAALFQNTALGRSEQTRLDVTGVLQSRLET